jgi:hypothetical protein
MGISKEEEERYQKLLAENEELQKLIAAVSFPFNNLQVLSNYCIVLYCIDGMVIAP